MKKLPEPSVAARLASAVAMGLIIVVIAAGCATTRSTNTRHFVTGYLPKPACIWVCDFAATAADVPTSSALAGQIAEHPKPQTTKEIAAGRKLGALIATQLVQELNKMGLPAGRYSAQTPPRLDDIVIQGYLIFIGKGSQATRIAIGFGAGASRLCTAVEFFQVTPQGLRSLSLGNVESRGGKKPGPALSAAGVIMIANPVGLVVGVIRTIEELSGTSALRGRARQTAKELGAVLKRIFQDQGWIQ